MNIILASKSPRRISLLKKTGLDFKVIPSKLDESLIQIKKDAKKHCQNLSILKAKSIAKKNPKDLAIGADTIVEIENKILEKPLNANNAFKMLKSLSGKEHSVHTGVAITSILNKININFVETTKVKFFNLTDSEINYYIKTCNPYDKSGSYGIQDRSALFVDYIIGNYENVIGFPISKIYKTLIELKIIK